MVAESADEHPCVFNEHELIGQFTSSLLTKKDLHPNVEILEEKLYETTKGLLLFVSSVETSAFTQPVYCYTIKLV